jgi:transposase
MAPALTPRRPGQRIKTDRRDATKLVRLFRAGELTPIRVPNEAEEAVRDLVRCREASRREVGRWRHRVLKFLDWHGRLYVTGKNWSRRHWSWIRSQHFDLPTLQRTFEATLFALEQALARVADLDREIAALAETEPYRTPVGWLRCFRGIDTLSAMVLVAEIVDFQRFPHPRELMAYLGLVPSEYSSGEAQRRGAITKAGNTHAGGCWSKPPGTIVTGPPSGARCVDGQRTSRPPSSLMPGERSSGSIGAIDISSGMVNGRRWPSWPWRASWSAFSGRR